MSSYVNDFFEHIRKVRVEDPITQHIPKSEVELTAIFVYRMINGEIKWAVPTEFFEPGNAFEDVSKVLMGDGTVLSEYPLFPEGDVQIIRWGGMRADALFLSNDERHVVLFEAKVDSYFTNSQYPPDGQLSRQLEYLDSLKLETRSLLLLCPKFNVGWYKERLQSAWEHHLENKPTKSGLSCGIITWEGILVPR